MKIVSIVFVLFFIFTVPASSNEKPNVHFDKKSLSQKLLKIQLPFIENQGQIKDSSVKFYVKTFTGTVFVTDAGKIVYNLTKEEQDTIEKEIKEHEFKNGENNFFKKKKLKGVAFSESFKLSKKPIVKGINKSETKVNYFKGEKINWKTNIPTWQEVTLGEIYENIELKLKAHGNNVEKIFTVYPNGTVNDINLEIDGTEELIVNKKGELEILTELGIVKMTKPVAYQEINGKREYIQATYKVSTDPYNYGFNVGEYDKTKPLIIDPLLASTFIGGSDYDYIFSLSLDSSDNIFVAGETASEYFPKTTGAYDEYYERLVDGFISKFDSDLSNLLSSTFIGGNGADYIYSLTLDTSGNVYIAGVTHSTPYPTTTGAYQYSNQGQGDGFISKLNNNLSDLLASTLIGDVYKDFINTITLDTNGNIYVAGVTQSPDYPTTNDAYQADFAGLYDGFISIFNSDLSELLASTFIGDEENDQIFALQLDSSDNVIVAGFSSSEYFPKTTGAYQEDFQGQADGFVSKFNSDLSELLASTFIGGEDGDIPSALQLDSSNNVFIAGSTESSNYPVTNDAYKEYYQGGFADGFVSKLNSNLTSLLNSTFIGGSNIERISTLALNSSGSVVFAGNTESDYPTTEGAYDRTYNGGTWDGFISILDNNLCENSPVRISDIVPSYYSSIQDAYDNAEDEDTIQIQDLVFTENLIIDIDKSVSIEGGYDCTYSTNTGTTKLKGDMTISSGQIIIPSGLFQIYAETE